MHAEDALPMPSLAEMRDRLDADGLRELVRSLLDTCDRMLRDGVRDGWLFDDVTRDLRQLDEIDGIARRHRQRARVLLRELTIPTDD